jgi:hypothetical protein
MRHAEGSAPNASNIRAKAVARAKALVSEPSYPDETVLSRVADVLAKSVELGDANLP